ncbi:MAG: DUF934 domain-containing protein [Methylococcales bacterium]
MQIIKDRQIIANTWTFVADDEQFVAGNITVSPGRWQQDKAKLLAHDGKIGVRITPADNIAELANDLNHLELIELYFPAFADGRLFSHAWLLRARYHYHGEIRAAGQYLPDQVFYLSRVGVNAFCPTRAEDITTTLSSLNTFTVKYQPSIN